MSSFVLLVYVEFTKHLYSEGENIVTSLENIYYRNNNLMIKLWFEGLAAAIWGILKRSSHEIIDGQIVFNLFPAPCNKISFYNRSSLKNAHIVSLRTIFTNMCTVKQTYICWSAPAIYIYINITFLSSLENIGFHHIFSILGLYFFL